MIIQLQRKTTVILANWLYYSPLGLEITWYVMVAIRRSGISPSKRRVDEYKEDERWQSIGGGCLAKIQSGQVNTRLRWQVYLLTITRGMLM